MGSGPNGIAPAWVELTRRMGAGVNAQKGTGNFLEVESSSCSVKELLTDAYTSEFQSGRKVQDRPLKAFVAILKCLGSPLLVAESH